MPRKPKSSTTSSMSLEPVLCAKAPLPRTRLLLVGDPHVTSQRVSRRIDDYAQGVLSDLEQCASLANNLGARMVVLGDLFDRPRESDIGLLSALIGVLKALPEPALVLVGNHDKTGSFLTQDTTLALLGRAGVVELIDSPRTINLPGLRLHGVPHGCALPEKLPADECDEQGEVECLSVMLTHHDLAIAPNLNPSAQAIVPVPGCDLVVNGHDHTTKPPAQIGETCYFNPGNISRVSVAQVLHRPAVYALMHQADQGDFTQDPAEASLFDPAPSGAEVDVGKGWILRRYELVHAPGPDVFDMTGYNAPATTDEALAAYLSDFSRTSADRFIEALSGASEMHAADGGDAVERVVREVMDDLDVEVVVRRIVEERILVSA